MDPFRRIPRGPLVLPGMLAVLFVVQNIYFQLVVFRFLTLRFEEGDPPVDLGPDRTTLLLFAGLGATGAVWAFLLARGRVSATTGGGFVPAALGLCLQFTAGATRGFGGPLLFEGTEAVGIAAYLFGLGFVIVTSIGDLRAGRRYAHWTPPF